MEGLKKTNDAPPWGTHQRVIVREGTRPSDKNGGATRERTPSGGVSLVSLFPPEAKEERHTIRPTARRRCIR
eukprot:6760753-Pyramimonas_sp.AAC.1